MNESLELSHVETSQSSTASSLLASIESSGTSTVSIADLSSCKYCKGISLESLSQAGGYRHASSRSSLVRSAQKCKLCSLIFRKDRAKKHNEPLYLALDTFGGDDDEQVCLRVSHGRIVEETSESDLVFFLYTSPGKFKEI
jgi:hypothetical protein